MLIVRFWSKSFGLVNVFLLFLYFMGGVKRIFFFFLNFGYVVFNFYLVIFLFILNIVRYLEIRGNDIKNVGIIEYYMILRSFFFVV